MEHYLTYKRLIELLKNNLPIKMKSLSTGDLSYLGKENNPDLYPLMHILPNQITYNENTTQFNLSILFCDIVNTDMSNEVTVISDMNLAARDFLSQIKLGVFYDYFDTELPNTSTTFLERFNDHLAGVELTIPVTIFEDMNACDQYEPVSPSPTPSVTPSITPSVTPSTTPTPSVTPSITATPSITPTTSITPTPTPSTTPTTIEVRARYRRTVSSGSGSRTLTVSAMQAFNVAWISGCFLTPTIGTSTGAITGNYNNSILTIPNTCIFSQASFTRDIQRGSLGTGNYQLVSSTINVFETTTTNLVATSTSNFGPDPIFTSPRTDNLSVSHTFIPGNLYFIEFHDVIQIL